MADWFDVSEALLKLENDEFGLSSGKESDLEGVEFHSYLSASSEIPVSEIGGADPPSTALSAYTHESVLL